MTFKCIFFLSAYNWPEEAGHLCLDSGHLVVRDTIIRETGMQSYLTHVKLDIIKCFAIFMHMSRPFALWWRV